MELDLLSPVCLYGLHMNDIIIIIIIIVVVVVVVVVNKHPLN